MHIRILAAGRLKTGFHKEACGEYLKRAQRFARISVDELCDQDARSVASQFEHQVKPVDRCFCLDEKGKLLSTADFAKLLKKHENEKVVFLIGPPDGLPAQTKAKYPMISLSPMTMSQELARVVLLEQVYRSLCVLNGHPYHRA